jgi:protein kinase A
MVNLVQKMKKMSFAPKDGKGLTKLIFAKPLKFTKMYTPPEKTASQVLDDSEQEFLTSIVTKHADFVLSNLDPSQVQTLIRAMETVSFGKDTTVMNQGDIGDYLYVVKEGTVKFVVDGEDKGTAEKGTVVGELALLYDCPRAATVVAETDVLMYRVSQETFRRIQAAFVLSNDDETRRLLKATKLFESLDDDMIKLLASSLFQKKIKKGDIIMKKGVTFTEMYFVKSGRIKYGDISVEGTKYADVTMGAGETFGERSLVLDKPCPGNVECVSSGVVWVLTKERFFRCLDGTDLHELTKKSLDRKFLSAIPLFAYSDIDQVEIDLMVEKFVSITLQPGEKLATIGDQVEPAAFFIQTRNKDTAYVQLANKDGVTKDLGPSEGFGFGGETLILSNIDGKTAAAYGQEHGLVGLGSENGVLTAKHNLLENGMVIAQSTVTAMGTEPVHIRKLSIKDVRDVIKDELRLGKDYRTNRAFNPNCTKEELEKKLLLGQGTFGQVWLCREPKSDSPYSLKIQYKRELIEQHQADGVIKEKRIMEKMNHPFVLGLVNAQQDKKCLYMAMKFIQGGELRTEMRNKDRTNLSEKASKFYAACMLEGLSYMHRRNYVYRDLKGENVLLDKDGYCVIIDLGFAKFVPDKTFTFCGTPIFIAPEVVLNKGHDKSADIWSLGVMIYEMLFGTNPFFDYDDPTIDQRTLFKRIVKGQFQRPRKQSSIDAYQKVDDNAKDLVKRMLVVDVKKRLGCMSRGDLDLRDHPWFSDPENGIDFGKLYRKEITAPWVPKISGMFDGSNFSAKREEDKSKLKPLSEKEQKQFEKFC